MMHPNDLRAIYRAAFDAYPTLLILLVYLLRPFHFSLLFLSERSDFIRYTQREYQKRGYVYVQDSFYLVDHHQFIK